ncbi:MAG: PolC-type DNA polymerase III [Ruminococcaceae bacterium]|nr:PolC-type DNA polymerase III [Oscillospiraceae bacterium]
MSKDCFFEKFSKYRPDNKKINEILESVEKIESRYIGNKSDKKVELTLWMPEPVEKSYIYRIEREMVEAYGLERMKILTKYPEDSFYDEYIHQVIIEAEDVGIVSNGFFSDYTYEINGDKIVIYIPFTIGGIRLMECAKTAGIISAIIRSEFGLEFEVRVEQSKGAEESFRMTLKQMEEELRSYVPPSVPQSENPEEEESANVKKLVTVIDSDPNAKREKKGNAEVSEDKTVSVGKMRFDLSSPEVFYIKKEVKEEEVFEPTPITEVTPLSEIYKPNARVSVVGKINSVSETPISKGTKVLFLIGITDNEASINIKLILENEKADSIRKLLKPVTREIRRGTSVVVTLYSMSLAVIGRIRESKDDKSDKGENELELFPDEIYSVKEIARIDDAEEKRVELHLHTNMSTMDALMFPELVVEKALEWGWDAIGVTDHGNVQAYPLMMNAARKKDIKILYGMEAYFVDDTARAVWGSENFDFKNDEFIVFDIETTGLTVLSSAITEIGAVKVKNGEVIEVFNTFADPECHIPEHITELTGITDEMVKGAPSQIEAVKSFLEFAGDRMLIAHNAGFDVGFIRSVCEKNKIPFKNSYLDTVALSKYVNPELKKHKLDSLAEYFDLGEFNHHRASDDAEMLTAIFFEMVKKLADEGVHNIAEMNNAMAEKADPLKLRPYHMVIYVKNLTGLKNLYKLISSSYLDYYYRNPRIPKTLLDEHREGLIIGSACEAGELYQAILSGKSADEIDKLADYYDYYEIQPLCNNMFMVANETVSDVEILKDINRKIVALGEEKGKLVVATCDVHFMNKEDEIFRKILQAGMKYSDYDRDTGLYLRTTKEMLEEFSYLGEEKAYEVVVTNTRKIADMIEKILPIPDGTFTPKMEGAEEELQEMCWKRAHDMYGEVLPVQVESRLKKELESIIKHGFAVLYMIAQKLVWYSEQQGYLVGSRGSVGSSFVATMAGISEVNPLPPHYRCPKCKYNRFIEDGSVGSGFDLETDYCPVCGERLLQDGHDIPFETFLGFYGDKSPDIDLNFSGEVQGKVHKYTEELFGAENVFRAGTLGTLASKTAYGYVMKYLDEKGIRMNKAEVQRLVNGTVGVKRTTGQHPGGIIVIPREYEVYDFTPVQHPADDAGSDIVTTHFAFVYLHDTILKLDELGHDMPTKYKWLEKYTGIDVMTVPMNDREVYELFLSKDSLNIVKGDIDCSIGTYGLPEFGTKFVMQMLEQAKPKNFADLLQISGLSHGTDVWLGNAQDLIQNNICTISEVVGTRDSIMLTLIRYGLDNAMSFQIMESVRKGKGLKPEWEAEMRGHNVPEWYIDSCKKIKYMFPKAHAAAYVMSAIRLGWYKVHKPLEFYAAYFSVAPGGFDAEIVSRGLGGVKAAMADIAQKQKDKTATQKDNDLYSTLQLVEESMARGVEYLPIDLYRSDATSFIPENGRIRMPFNTLGGLGDSAAVKIIEARKSGEFMSKLDFAERTGLSKSVMQTLDSAGVFKGMSETNQISLF